MDMGHGRELDGGHTHAPGSHLSYMCDGTHWTGMAYQRPSNWSTHVIPGVMVTIWALHWTIGVFKAWLTSSRTQPYKARTTYDVFPIPTAWMPESWIKILFPFFAILAQLWWSHGHWSRSICEPGTLREGHFAITAVHNWQNAWTLFAYMMAGVVDIVSRYLVLPPNLPHFMTCTAFALQAFGLYQGQHQDMLDLMVYYLAFMAVGATAVIMLAEIAYPEAFWLGCLKVYTLWLQAIWYFATARFLFEGRPAWDTIPTKVDKAPTKADMGQDMSPEMFAPVIFVMWMNITAVALLLCFVFMRWWFAAHLNEHLRASCSVERTLITVSGGGQRTPNSKGDVRGAPTHELMPLVSRLS